MSGTAERAVEGDAAYMRRALELARRGWGTTHPNPMVGAVLVEAGEIAAEGWHERAGGAHAEVAALRALGRKPKEGATLYVTLEPCSTCGRTGACTDAILAAGIRRVVVAADDPNPDHAGRAYPLLRAAGVEVRTGVLAAESTRLNFLFNHWITRREPLFAAKLALTLDGKMATRTGHSRWITGPVARADVMRWRALFPAIVVGAGTIIADDPALTIRGPGGGQMSCPKRYILDRSLRTVADGELMYRVYNDEFKTGTTLVAGEIPPDVQALLDARGIRWVSLGASGDGPFFRAFKQYLAREEVPGALFEPGPRLFGALLASRELDYGIFYVAPKLIGDGQAKGLDGGWQAVQMSEALTLADPRSESFPPDVRIDGYFNYE